MTNMTLREEIEACQKIIEDTSGRIKQLEKAGGLKKLFGLGRNVKKLKKLEDLQFYKIDAFLKSSDSKYNGIVRQNYELLETPKIHFTVYSTGRSFTGNRSKQIDGDIYPNGYSYSYSSKSSIAILPFDSMSFPSKMSGHIDYWGRLRLKTTKVDYSLMKSLPSKLQGYVGENGFIEIETTDTSWEVTEGTTMGKLIANHFEYDEQKNFDFQSNRDALRDSVYEFWNEIKN